MSTQDQDFDAASLHTIKTGSNETMISANKSMFFLEMNPFAPVTVVLLHMLCKTPRRMSFPESHIVSVLRLIVSDVWQHDRAMQICADHNICPYQPWPRNARRAHDG